MLLGEYVLTYIQERPGLTEGYRSLLRATVYKFGAWSGRRLTLEEVDRPLLAGWAEHLLATDRPATVNKKLRLIRTLLLSAYDDGILDRPPRRVRRVQEVLATPEAWTTAECRRLFSHLVACSGQVGERPAFIWWTSLVLTVYWTGCRIGALLAAQSSDYSPGAGLLIRKQKNGRAQWYPLPPSCCEWIDKVLPASGPIWPWPRCRRALWLRFRRHVEAAGLPCPRTGRQLFHRLRRTHLSYCWREDPVIAQHQADHASAETTRRHYVDPRIAYRRSAADILPDPLGPPEDDGPCVLSIADGRRNQL